MSLLLAHKLIFVLILLKPSMPEDTTNTTNIRELTAENYTIHMNSDVSFVVFYSPDCQYCVSLLPAYKEAADVIRENATLTHVDFYQLNCIENGYICDAESIEAYPTVKIFFDGVEKEVLDNEAVSRNDLVQAANNYGYTSKEVMNRQDLDRFLDTNSIVLMGYFEKYSGLQAAFMRCSLLFRNKFKFGYVNKKDLLGELKNHVVLYRPRHLHNKFEEDNLIYSGPGEVQELHDFIKRYAYGLVGHRTRENLEDFDLPHVVAYYDVDYYYSTKLTNYWRNRILKVATKFPQITFAVSSKYDFVKDLFNLGVNMTINNTTPVVFATNPLGIHYMLEDDFTIENLEIFVKDFLNQKLEPYVRSEPIPEDNDDIVKTLVGKNFHDIFHHGKDVFINFYTPWCLVCLEFANTFEDVALEFGNDEIILARMDVGANDHPKNFVIKSYPTFYFVPRNSYQEPILYKGPLTFQGMIDFIAQHASVELTRNDSGKERKKSEL